MEITIQKTDRNFAFIGSNGEAEVLLCSAPKLEEGNTGFRPMELILISLGGCLSMDVLNILYKQRQEVTAYTVKLRGERRTEIPATFERVYIDLYLYGTIKEEKLRQAIRLSEEKYCSGHKMLSPPIFIQTQFFLNHEE